MIIAVLVVLGLCLGSFVNALCWRLHEQAREKEKVRKGKSKRAVWPFPLRLSTGQNRYSILTGRSMCPHCEHELAAGDLIPVLSWLMIRGKCRYCRAPISVQYPLVEGVTAGLFVLSYVCWPVMLTGAAAWTEFGLWLILLVGFMALTVYDLRWFLLPNRIVYPLGIVAALLACVGVAIAADWPRALLNTALGLLAGGGIFFILFQLSEGKWIGGGDVKLGFLLGLIAASPARSLLLIFLAALLGSLVSLPLLMSRRLKRTSVVPFGPFLILAVIIVQLFGTPMIDWYQNLFMI